MMLANLGDCFLKQKSPANALVCLNAALEMNPDSAKAHKIYTKACCALGKWEEALQHAQLALKIDFDDMAFETEKTLNAKLRPIHEKKAQLSNAEKDLEFAEKLSKQDELRQQRKKEEEAEAAKRMADMAGGILLDQKYRTIPLFDSSTGPLNDACLAFSGMPGGFPGGGMPGGGMPGGAAGMAGMMNDPDIQAAMSNPKVRQTSQSDQLPSNKVLILRALSQGDGGAPGDDDQPGGDGQVPE